MKVISLDWSSWHTEYCNISQVVSGSNFPNIVDKSDNLEKTSVALEGKANEGIGYLHYFGVCEIYFSQGNKISFVCLHQCSWEHYKY